MLVTWYLADGTVIAKIEVRREGESDTLGGPVHSAIGLCADRLLTDS
jgi:hypothetical protein